MTQTQFKLINIGGRKHVVTFNERKTCAIRVKDGALPGEYDKTKVSDDEEIEGSRKILIPASNYAGTGMALTGVLELGETLAHWLTRKCVGERLSDETKALNPVSQ